MSLNLSINSQFIFLSLSLIEDFLPCISSVTEHQERTLPLVTSYKPAWNVNRSDICLLRLNSKQEMQKTKSSFVNLTMKK